MNANTKEINAMTTKHTLTPWKPIMNEGWTIIQDSNNRDICKVYLPMVKDIGYDNACAIQDANGRHIVKCVNNHERLLETVIQVKAYLKRIEKHLPENQDTEEIIYGIAEAIKQAKSGS